MAHEYVRLVAVVFQPGLLLLVTGLAAAYYWLAGGRWQARGGVYFAGLALFALAELSPLHYLGMHALFSAHMVVHIVVLLLSGPLLVLGLPPQPVPAAERGWPGFRVGCAGASGWPGARAWALCGGCTCRPYSMPHLLLCKTYSTPCPCCTRARCCWRGRCLAGRCLGRCRRSTYTRWQGWGTCLRPA
ncbi:cytochrome c oxidase assembly protein [Hymenobacter sp. BRD67]|nr:cytochrome c oxidase assembly protein [Hymenobacter sp. BRD67]